MCIRYTVTTGTYVIAWTINWILCNLVAFGYHGYYTKHESPQRYIPLMLFISKCTSGDDDGAHLF